MNEKIIRLKSYYGWTARCVSLPIF